MARPPPVSVEVVALKYDQSTQHAPQMVAKGSGHIGDKILQVAREHQIPLYQDPELARLLGQLELGDEIPEALYKAVAQVILFAWELNGTTPPAGVKPPEPPQTAN